MAKNAVSDWSTTDSLNTDVGGTNIAEGCAPGGINDAIRKVMSQIATWYASITTTVAGLMPKSGGAFTGGITGTTAGFSGAVTTGALTASGGIKRDAQFYMDIGASNAILNWDTNDSFYFDRTANAASVLIGGAVVATIDASKINANGLQVSGNNVWHAGNLTPSNYALLSGAAFTGGITGTTATFSGAIKRDANLYIDLSGSNPVLNFDSNDWISYDRTANKYYFNIGGTAVASIDASGNLKVLGNITASAGTV